MPSDPKDRLIVALDVDSLDRAAAWSTPSPAR